MITNAIVLYVLLFVLSVLFIIQAFELFKLRKKAITQRRRWARIKVPNEKMITCRIAEPSSFASDSEWLINDINMAGVSFFCDKKIEKVILKLLIKFPFTTFKDAGTVWGKVAYCNKIPDMEKYRIGIAYIRKTKWSK